MKPKSPQPVNFFDFAKEHLFYEVQMFVLARAIQPGGDQFLENLMVEDTVLHLRNLIEFFYPVRPKVDDVIAEHYVANWNTKGPAISPVLEKARKRANKQLHHLTTQRIAGTPPEKRWDFVAISKEMKVVVAAFLGLQPNMPQNTISELLKI